MTTRTITEKKCTCSNCGNIHTRSQGGDFPRDRNPGFVSIGGVPMKIVANEESLTGFSWVHQDSALASLPASLFEVILWRELRQLRKQKAEAEEGYELDPTR